MLEKTNSSVQADELKSKHEICSLQRTNLPDFPIIAFLSISFTHHTAILANAKTYEERRFYIQYAADYKVMVDDLVSFIKGNLYSHQGDLPNNFKKTIPDQLQAYRAITMFKDEYLLDFINTKELL